MEFTFLSADFFAQVEQKKVETKKRFHAEVNTTVDSLFAMFTEEFNRRIAAFSSSSMSRPGTVPRLSATSTPSTMYGHFIPNQSFLQAPFSTNPVPPGVASKLSSNLASNVFAAASNVFSSISSDNQQTNSTNIIFTNWHDFVDKCGANSAPESKKVPNYSMPTTDKATHIPTSSPGPFHSNHRDTSVAVHMMNQQRQRYELQVELFPSLSHIPRGYKKNALLGIKRESSKDTAAGCDSFDDLDDADSDSVICLDDETEAEASAAEVAASARRSVKRTKEDADDDGEVEDGEVLDNGQLNGIEPKSPLSNGKFILLSYKCYYENCQAMFVSKTDLGMHLISEHRILSYRCLQGGCKKSFYFCADLVNHMEEHRDISQWLCDVAWCSKVFKSYRALWLHNYQVHQTGIFKCTSPNCEYIGQNRYMMNMHHDRQHRVFPCTFAGCDRRFNNRYHLQVHQRDDHSTGKWFSCKWTNCTFFSKHGTAAVAHVRAIHFGLPITQKEQRELNIHDDRSAYDFIHVHQLAPTRPAPV